VVEYAVCTHINGDYDWYKFYCKNVKNFAWKFLFVTWEIIKKSNMISLSCDVNIHVYLKSKTTIKLCTDFSQYRNYMDFDITLYRVIWILAWTFDKLWSYMWRWVSNTTNRSLESRCYGIFRWNFLHCFQQKSLHFYILLIPQTSFQ